MKKLSATVASLALALGVSAVAPAAANADAHGTNSLAAVLLADGDEFDSNWRDYDIVTQAVLAVLTAKPGSDVGVLTDGSVPLTAFIPNDRAFQILAEDLTGVSYATEGEVLGAIAGAVGIANVEAVLLYHVVPGATIDSATALTADGAELSTGLPGSSFEVDVISKRAKVVRLIDADTNDRNPFLDRRALDINKGNLQIAHGITAVLRPIDL